MARSTRINGCSTVHSLRSSIWNSVTAGDPELDIAAFITELDFERRTRGDCARVSGFQRR
jgi:hypothetical protein